MKTAKQILREHELCRDGGSVIYHTDASIEAAMEEYAAQFKTNSDKNIGQELEFNVYGTIIKGKYLKMIDDKTIKIEVTYDESGQSEIGCIGNINKSFLINGVINTCPENIFHKSSTYELIIFSLIIVAWFIGLIYLTNFN